MGAVENQRELCGQSIGHSIPSSLHHVHQYLHLLHLKKTNCTYNTMQSYIRTQSWILNANPKGERNAQIDEYPDGIKKML